MKFALIAMIATSVSAVTLKSMFATDPCESEHLEKEEAWACIEDEFSPDEREVEKAHFFKLWNGLQGLA